MSDQTTVTIALDYGSKRIGVAICNSRSDLPKPLKTLLVDEKIIYTIKSLILSEQANSLVVGLPRGLDGQSTAQTKIVESFATNLRQELAIPVYLIDEAVTSVAAEEELKSRGRPYRREDIDSLAAVYILEDFLSSSRQAV